MCDGPTEGAEGAPRTGASRVKPAIFAGLALAVVVASLAFGGAGGLASFQPWADLETLVEENLICALAVYFACTVVGCTVLVLPGAAFALAAGMLFGPVLGTVACAVAATAGAVASFLVGRYFLRDAIRPKAVQNPYLRKWLFDGNERGAVATLAVTRLIPLFPYNLQNFAYGVTDMKVSTYAALSFLFMVPGTAMYVLAGAGICEGTGGVRYFALAVALAAVVCVVAALLKKRYAIGEGCSDGKGAKGK